MRLWSKLSVMLSALLSVACSVSPPKDIKVVTPFDSQRYLGFGTKSRVWIIVLNAVCSG